MKQVIRYRIASSEWNTCRASNRSPTKPKPQKTNERTLHHEISSIRRTCPFDRKNQHSL